jgi:hypothetical protein
MATALISWTKTEMVSVIIVRMPARERKIVLVVEWVVSIAMDREMGMVVVMDAVTSIGMVAENRITTAANPQKPSGK